MLHEIESAATSVDTSLSVVLRKCKILAARLDHAPLSKWVDWELSGYPSIEVLPPYRVHNTEVQGDFSGYFQSWMKNVSVPRTLIPDEHRDWLFTNHFKEGVAHYEALIATGEHMFVNNWPSEVVALYGQSSTFLPDYNMMAARKLIPVSQFVQMLDAIRNKVLCFVLDIERENPEAGEGPVGAEPVPHERVTQIFTTNIYGGSNVWAAGSTEVTQATTQVAAGDWIALRQALTRIGIPEEDVDDLRIAIDEDRQSGTDLSSEASRVKGWLGRTTVKLATGALAVTNNDAAGGIIAGLVLAFLGQH